MICGVSLYLYAFGTVDSECERGWVGISSDSDEGREYEEENGEDRVGHCRQEIKQDRKRKRDKETAGDGSETNQQLKKQRFERAVSISQSRVSPYVVTHL